MPAVHISPFSGSWYPEAAADLEHLLEERFEESCRRTGPFLFPDGLGFVVPHAGPAYSGTVAAAVYRSIGQQQPERIVLLAFPHHGGLRGVAAPDVETIATPFGEVPICGEWPGGFVRLAEESVCDHSFEIQLPFLQKAAPKAKVTPLYVGSMSADERRAAAERLAAAWRPGVVFIASSDFTHYGRSFGYVPFPADSAVAARLHELDHECIDAAGSLDSALFLDALEERSATVCGTGPIALLLDVLRRLPVDGVYQATLDYQASGELTRDYRHSVSYAALGYFPRSAFDLAAEDCGVLLDVAEETLLRLRQTGERRPAPARGGSAALQARRGAFVSLHQEEELLGCVGNCSGRQPLAEEIGDLTLAAALEDPRFRPAAEVQGPIDLEISVLTPFRRIRDIGEFGVGRHGAVLRLQGHSGLLLPQVAEDRGWTAEDFFRALARKSMLGPQAWRDPKVRLEIFEAQVFARPGR
ncbi:MAG TPA: AmmeMemoRadiSam system protein B [Bryobacteraceae bacterium]|nr:AmmeMemoRadiSam system protein B [Bryobacteraceae bacterium]